MWAAVPTVVINGEAHALDRELSVQDLLARLGLDPRHVAVERNRDIVPKAAFATTQLQEGDRLEVVTFVGGG